MRPSSTGRERWSSRLGFVLAASGSAVGLGNIWRFPFKVGTNGGGAFVLLYLACLLLICVPYLYAELALGRASQKNPVGAISAMTDRPLWPLVGGLCVLSGLFILSYYAVVAGWAVGYIFKGVVAPAATSNQFFGRLVADPVWVLLLFALFTAVTVGVVYGGIQRGIERWSKILMPVLVALMFMVIFRAVTLPGAGAGLEFYLNPDFSSVTGLVVVEALGQAFFSLSLGMGAMITYASYLSEDENLIASGGYIALFDTAIALLAGLMIFPAVFAMGQDPAEGPELVFVVLPTVFDQMPLGTFVGVLFFVLLSIAALTSSISLLEVVVSYVVDETSRSRRHAAWLVGGLVFLLGLPSALSQGAVAPLSDLSWLVGDRVFGENPSVLDVMDFLWGSVALTVGGLLLSIFVGWVWSGPSALRELRHGSGYTMEDAAGLLWSITIRYVCPITILFVLIFEVFYGVAP